MALPELNTFVYDAPIYFCINTLAGIHSPPFVFFLQECFPLEAFIWLPLTQFIVWNNFSSSGMSRLQNGQNIIYLFSPFISIGGFPPLRNLLIISLSPN